jgi:type III secretory pathway lipoprotein EscJ
MTTIKTYMDSAQAYVAKTLLEANEIEAFLFDENCNALKYYSVPIRLLVHDDKVDEAVRLLSSTGIELPEDAESE